MKEQLISFDTAKLAKEKGFSQKTDNFYRNNGVLVGKQGVSSGLVLPVKSGINRQVAPTQSLLQKWLRDNHNIYVTVTVAPLSGVVDFYYTIRYGENISKFRSGNDPLTHDTYEEALEEGLIEGLNLIE